MKYIIYAATLLVAGCGGNQVERLAANALYSAENPPKLDQRLLTPCPAFTQTLSGGTEKETLSFIDSSLKSGDACRKEKQEWIDWYNLTFTVKK